MRSGISSEQSLFQYLSISKYLSILAFFLSTGVEGVTVHHVQLCLLHMVGDVEYSYF